MKHSVIDWFGKLQNFWNFFILDSSMEGNCISNNSMEILETYLQPCFCEQEKKIFPVSCLLYPHNKLRPHPTSPHLTSKKKKCNSLSCSCLFLLRYLGVGFWGNVCNRSGVGLVIISTSHMQIEFFSSGLFCEC